MTAAWASRAACRTLPVRLFFPQGPMSNAFIAQTEKARRVCETCPVQQLCLDDALADEVGISARDREGVRGGFTGRERFALARGRRLPVRPLPVPDDGREHGLRRTYRQGCRCFACRAVEARKRPSGRPRTLAPCGTVAAFDRHRRRGEPVDAACIAAKRAHGKSRRLTVIPGAVCGTRSGFRNHTARNEVPCAACTRAAQAVAWLQRQGALVSARQS